LFHAHLLPEALNYTNTRSDVNGTENKIKETYEENSHNIVRKNQTSPVDGATRQIDTSDITRYSFELHPLRATLVGSANKSSAN
jgi:hypothetical protein